MIIKHISTLAVAATMVLLSGCETEMEITLFTSDMLELEGDVEADAQLFFEIPHDEWLEEDNNQANLSHFLTKHFGKLGEFSTKTIEFTSFCIIPFKTVITDDKKNPNMFGLSRKETEDSLDVYCEINPEKFKTFKDAVSDEFFSTVKFEDVKFRLLLDNDTKETVKVTGYSAYLGKLPAAFEGSVMLGKRKELTMQISQIHMATIKSGGKSRLLSLSKN